VSSVSLPSSLGKPKAEFASISISAELILDRRELDRLALLASKSRTFSEAVALMGSRLREGQDVPIPAVYRLDQDMYEVDWELTPIAEPNFQALALAAFHSHRAITCRLVLPKPQRNHGQVSVRYRPILSEPVTYGQMHLAI